MTRSIRNTGVVFGMILASLGVALAEEPARPWTDTADFGLVMTTGNTQNLNFSLTNKFIYKWSNADFTFDATALRTENTERTLVNDTVDNTVVATDKKTVTAEMYGLAGKYTRKIHENLYWYVRAGWMSNKPTGIDSRYGGGAGIGYTVLKTDADVLSLEFGADYTDESQTSGFSDSYAGFRAYLNYLHNISKTATFRQELEILENLSETSDLRARSISSVTASLSAKMALKVGLTLLYDNQPVVVDVQPTGDATEVAPFEYDNLDTMLTAALVINF